MKKNLKSIVKTPWDSRVFGMDTYEIQVLSKEVMENAVKLKGHFAIKVDSLCSKKLLYDYGFYYCDTLIEPFCTPEKLVYFRRKNVHITDVVDIDKLADMSNYEFLHGRFHRDFHIDKGLADLRHTEWLKKLHASKGVFILMFNNDVAGFFAFKGSKIVLHAINKKYKAKGLSKYFWSVACKKLFNMGHKELTSSISASNMPALNLYYSLGFKFRNPRDVYHKLII